MSVFINMLLVPRQPCEATPFPVLGSPNATDTTPVQRLKISAGISKLTKLGEISV